MGLSFKQSRARGAPCPPSDSSRIRPSIFYLPESCSFDHRDNARIPRERSTRRCDPRLNELSFNRHPLVKESSFLPLYRKESETEHRRAVRKDLRKQKRRRSVMSALERMSCFNGSIFFMSLAAKYTWARVHRALAHGSVGRSVGMAGSSSVHVRAA